MKNYFKISIFSVLVMCFSTVFISCQSESIDEVDQEMITEESKEIKEMTDEELDEMLTKASCSEYGWAKLGSSVNFGTNFTLQCYANKDYLDVTAANNSIVNGTNLTTTDQAMQWRFNKVPGSDDLYTIQELHSIGRIWDVEGYATGNGGNIHLWEPKFKSNGSPASNQVWHIYKYKSLNVYRFQNPTSQKFLAIRPSTGNVLQWQRQCGERNQFWEIDWK